jgi:hypothetical protein
LFSDSGKALTTWARKNKFNTALLEPYVSNQHLHEWNDFVGIFLKDEKHAAKYPNRLSKPFKILEMVTNMAAQRF